jgi:hypothetical protein
MTKPTTFHDPPPKGSKYAEVIERAKAARVPDRPKDMTGTPSFEDTQKSWESRQAPKTQLSPQTTAGLSALAAQVPPPQEEDEETNAPEARTEAPEKELDENEKLRRAVESRLREGIDIGQYLMNGEVTQAVPIIPGKLEVVFRSVTDMEEAYVDTQLSKNKEATARVFLRSSNELALSFHIFSVNGNRWPPTVVNGEIHEAAIEKRLGHVRKLSSPVFQLITQNLVWFLERVTKGLTMEVLGNG